MSQQLSKECFAGREEELKKLNKCLDDAAQGQGSLVLVEGEAGSGKTRFINEVGQRAISKGFYFLTGRCPPAGKSEPYLPFVEALVGYFQQTQAQEKGSQITKVINTAPKVLVNLIPAIGEFREKEVSPAVPVHLALMHLQTEKDRMFETISQLLIGIGMEKPLLLFLDDIHNIDLSSMALLHYVARNVREARVLVCAGYTPEEFRLGGVGSREVLNTIRLMNREKLFTKLELKRLTAEDVSDLVKSLAHVEAVPKALTDFLHEKTGGNPFLVEEIVRVLMDKGMLPPPKGEVLAEIDTSKIEVPKKIEDAILSRTGKLDKDALTVLSCASVIGQNFKYDILKSIVGMDEEALVSALDKLIEANIIAEGKSGTSYKFAYPLTQEVTYSHLNDDRRKEMHRQIGNHIENMYKDKIDEVVYELTYHFTNTDDYEKALTYSVKAGDRAKGIFAPDEAIKYYESASRSLDKLKVDMQNKKKKINILSNLGSMYRVVGELDSALEQYINATKLSKEIDDKNWEAKSYIEIGAIKSLRNEWNDSIKNFEKGLKIAERINDIHTIGEAYRDMGYVYWHKAEFDKSLDYFDKSIECGKKTNDSIMIAYAYLRIGRVYSDKGEQNKSLSYLQKSIGIAEPVHDFYTIIAAYNDIGEVYRIREEYDKAIEYYEKQIELAKKIGLIRFVGFGLSNAGECYAKKLELDKAKEYCDKALEIFTKLGEKYMIATAYYNYGIIYKFKRDWEKSIECFQRCLKMFGKLNMPFDLVEIYYEFALMYKYKGNKKEAARYLDKARTLSIKIGAKGYLEKAEKELAEIKTIEER